jgi:hypothetical protein
MGSALPCATGIAGHCSGNLRSGPVGPLPRRSGSSRHRRPPAAKRVVRPQSSRPLQGIAVAPAACLRGGSTGLERTQGLPGFLPLQHTQIGTFTHFARVCRTRLRSASRVSNPLDGLPRPDPSGLVSSRKRSWGCALQSFLPSEEPLRLSAPAALLTLPSPARLAAPSERRHTRNHGSSAQVRPATPREPAKAAFRAFLPSEIRSHPAVV